jgi:hypothetical protein
MRYPILDYDLGLLRELLRLIDRHFDDINQRATQVGDIDGFGYIDSAEHATGLGFVACQTYVSSVYGRLKIDKQTALLMGPRHSSGQTKVQIINHAANYWKHNNEWSLEKNDKQRRRVEDAFKSAGFPVDADNPLLGVLSEITSPDPVAFESILKILELWREELYNSTT